MQRLNSNLAGDNFAHETKEKTNSDGRPEGREDGSSIQYRLHSLWWSNHFDLHRDKSQRRQFLKHALTSPLEHGRPPDGTTFGVQKLCGCQRHTS